MPRSEFLDNSRRGKQLLQLNGFVAPPRATSDGFGLRSSGLTQLLFSGSAHVPAVKPRRETKDSVTKTSARLLHRTRAMLEPDCGWREQFRRGRRRGVRVLVTLVVLSIPVIVFALIGLPHVVRGPVVRNLVAGRKAALSVADPEFPRVFTLLTGARLTGGHDVAVLARGDTTFFSLWRDLAAARRSITVQMYYIGPGRVVDSTIALLAERARAGVSVYFLYDAFGGEAMPARLLDTLLRAGAQAAEFRPLRWYTLDRASHRSHVRGFVIDGSVAYTGGFGLDDKWLETKDNPLAWRETNARFTGPSVSLLQAAFVAEWAEATGELLLRTRLLNPAPEPATNRGAGSDAALLYSPPVTGSTLAERLLALTIASAARQLYITNAYFVPQADFVALLIDAAWRGVDVRILTNGPGTDVQTTRLAGHRQYEKLLRAGVRIWEYRPTTIHAKTISVDGGFAAITTMNFDNRSLAYNNEVAFIARDSAIAAVLDSAFLKDLDASGEVTLDTFTRRSPPMRVLEWVAGLLSSIL